MTEIAHIHYSRSRRVLALKFVDGTEGELSAELLRVYSPSAEVRGHGPGQEVLQVGKKNVAIVDIRQAGHYAVQLVFDDGHDSGIYTWNYLKDLLHHWESHWQRYLQQLAGAGKSRDPDTQVLHFQP